MGEKQNKKNSFSFPFPGKELADKELSYDPCYSKIPEEDRKRITENAWNKGAKAAEEAYTENNGSTDFFDICRRHGLKINEKNIDYIAGNQRYFSDYVSGKSEVNLYLKSVQMWADENKLSLHDAENMILSHEYFHFLEVTKIGMTSREYQVPMVIIGSVKIGKTGIRALSEIGAHAFARTYWEKAHAEK